MNGCRLLAVSALCFSMIAGHAAAASVEELRASLQDALARNDAAQALILTESMYDAAIAVNDVTSAGSAAYTRGELLVLQNDHANAAEAYGRCESHYRTVGAPAESLQCAYKEGVSLSASGRPGTGLDKLKSVAGELESIGQAKSGLAAQVYLSLAKETLPSKLKWRDGATAARLNAVKYADKSLQALEAVGHTQSDFYASALYLKAEALEDAKEFEQAANQYAAFIELYETLPGHSADMLKNARTRYSIACCDDADRNKKIIVAGPSGDEITLSIKKGKEVGFPKLPGRQVVDGARAIVEVTLEADGRVALAEITMSEPDPAFGEALHKAVKTWRFEPPDGVSGTDIPPFEYGMVFGVTRRAQ